MKNLNKPIFITFICGLICLIGCANKLVSESSSKLSLGAHFKDLFYMGAAINENTILGLDPKSATIVNSEFNTITPENSLKWMFIQPKPNKFNFKAADKYVEMGLKNNMYIVGHALVWHAQLADFMQNIDNSVEARKHVDNHINRLVSRYKGKIDAWDVVNEAFEEDGSLRASVFYKNMGENYIEEVF